MRLLAILILAIGFASGQPRPVPRKTAPPRPRVDLIQLGTFHKGEAEFASGGGWIGLTPSRDGFAWNRFRIRTTKVEDPLGLDDGKLEATQVELESPVPELPIFLLRGLPSLASKPVHTCFDKSETGSFWEQNPILLTCEARAFRVEVTNVNKTDTLAGPSLLRFTHAGITQTLYRWPQGLMDQHAELIWVGDLDGDGKVDLLVDHSEHYNVSMLTLYLSTYAGPGQLVGRVATFRTVGC